jgi:endonuclease/exonuclease/phosphatase family metal-dependent hydrolase
MVERLRVLAGGINGRRRALVDGALGAVVLATMIIGGGVRLFAAGDIVLYTTDFTTIRGNWAAVAASGAAGGQVLSSVDRGWATADSPRATPADYVEATFNAPSLTPYHVWVRLRAAKDSKYNESVWLQFSDALDVNRHAVHQIGSIHGLAVNLENCNRCGVSGWGWQDKSYWLQQPNVVQFASGTTHTIRVQTREDGVQIDQVILSPATYLSNAPGSVRNDTKIVAKSGATAVTPGAGGLPAAPNSSNPPNAAAGVTVRPNLSWNAARATSYEVRIGTTNPPRTALSNTADFWYAPPALSSGTKYYWQVVAKNSSGSVAGPVWSFITAGAATASPAAPAAPAPAPPAPAPAPTPAPIATPTAGIAVVTWNIQVNDSSAAHARTAMDYLAALSPRPQVIVIQEGHKSQYATYLSELQNRTGLTWSGVFQPHCPPNAWNGSSCTAAEDEGVGVLTSLPTAGSGMNYLPSADNYHSARSVVRLAVKAGGRTVQVFGAHMPLVPSSRNNAMVALKRWASGFSTPQLVAGDFNADPDQIDLNSAMGSAFVDSWSLVGSGRGLTCTTPSPTMKLDYWFADRSGAAQPLWSSVVTSTGTVSDHFPVVAYFNLR